MFLRTNIFQYFLALKSLFSNETAFSQDGVSDVSSGQLCCANTECQLSLEMEPNQFRSNRHFLIPICNFLLSLFFFRWHLFVLVYSTSCTWTTSVNSIHVTDWMLSSFDASWITKVSLLLLRSYIVKFWRLRQMHTDSLSEYTMNAF